MTCSHEIARQVRGCRGIRYRPARFRYTCSTAIYDLQSADFLRFFIRNLRYSFDLLSGFTRGEYHIVCVDFIVALRRTKGRGRRTLRSPPSPSSGLHLIHPGLSAAAGHICCRGFIPIQVAVFRCYRYSPVPNFVRVLCVRAGIARVSVGLLGYGRTFFIIGG